MDTISLLITGGSPQDRLDAITSYQQDLPFPPTVLDGQLAPITIKEVRQFQHAINLTPPQDTLQRHFILEAQRLTLPAQHALLKTLEEPPIHTQIILTVDHLASLLTTILSRCQVIKLTNPQPTDDQASFALLRAVATTNHRQLIALAQDLAKTNPQSSLSDLQSVLRTSLITKPKLSRTTAIRATQQAISDLNTNANKQLILEHFLFTLHSLTKR